MIPRRCALFVLQQRPRCLPSLDGLPLSRFACSGGHYNPAVTLGVWLVGGLNMMMVIPYWVAQLCGGLIGAGLAKVRSGIGKREQPWEVGAVLLPRTVSFPPA